MKRDYTGGREETDKLLVISLRTMKFFEDQLLFIYRAFNWRLEDKVVIDYVQLTGRINLHL